MSVTVTRKNPGWIAGVMQRMQKVASNEVAVGFPRGTAQAYPDGTTTTEVAVINCYGMGVPQRDFMAYGKVLIDRDQTIKKLLSEAAKEGGQERPNPNVIKSIQEAAGQQAAALIKEAITEGDWVPNSPKTVQAKKSSKPLIDTALMRNAVTYVVRPKGAL